MTETDNLSALVPSARAVMEQIGHGWETSDLDVFQEHRASRIVESAITGLIANLPANLSVVDAPGVVHFAVPARDWWRDIGFT